MKAEAFAKVNLALDILGLRKDGYHELDMVMAPVNLFDELYIEPAGQDEITAEGMELPAANTLSRTLEILREKAGLKGHYCIRVIKNIPDQAGLGGGSADAAALIHALNTMENLGLSLKEKQRLGALIGADVPYCLSGGYARVRGIGEQVEPLDSDWKIPVLLAKPEQGVSTPECFKAFDAIQDHRAADVDIVADAVEKQDLALLYQTMTNSLEQPAFELLPALKIIREKLGEEGIVRVVMSGSGSCLMGFCVDEDVMEEAAKAIEPYCSFVYLGEIGL